MTMMQPRTIFCAALAAALILGLNAFSQEDSRVPPRDSVSRDSRREADSMARLVNQAMNGPTLQTRNPRYTLRSGDVIEISFLLAPAFNQLRSVQPDGYIALQNLEDLYVAGKTVPELTEALKQKYAKIMRDPIITVVLKEFEHPYFIASGQLARPGKYELRGITTVTQAIAIAGGFSDFAKTSHVLLFRRVSPDSVSVKQLDVKNMLSHGKLQEDVELQPDDIVYVPKSVTASILQSLFSHTGTGFRFPISF